ncbi:sulfite exporter TauE/SafE family protein [Castellaniella sp. GW247-6E4]|uniref:sulfite exporter TauE/SafE family protein n=1 Tax=Castellaniella sp. GW247-6E4 TaxID=3140380 RepID=UPI003315EF58
MDSWAVGAATTLWIYAGLCVVTCLAGTMRGFAGFGSGLLMAPVFSLAMPPADVVVLILALNLATTFQLMREALRLVQWPLVLRLFIPSLAGIPIGLGLIHLLDPPLIRKMIAVLVALISIALLSGWYYDARRGRLSDSVTGLLSGALTSLAGIGGPPVILYLLSDRQQSPRAARATCLVFFFLAQIAIIVPLAIGGSIGARQGSTMLALLPAYILGNWIGLRAHLWSAGRFQRLGHRASLIILLMTSAASFFV